MERKLIQGPGYLVVNRKIWPLDEDGVIWLGECDGCDSVAFETFVEAFEAGELEAGDLLDYELVRVTDIESDTGAEFFANGRNVLEYLQACGDVPVENRPPVRFAEPRPGNEN